MVSETNCLKYFCVIFVLYHQVHSGVLIALHIWYGTRMLAARHNMSAAGQGRS
jgi:hypothetical protein